MTIVTFQLHSLSVGLDNLILPSEETKQKIIESAAAQAAHKEEGEKKPKWRRGELEFEGLMRHLDNSVCKQPLLALHVSVVEVDILGECN